MYLLPGQDTYLYEITYIARGKAEGDLLRKTKRVVAQTGKAAWLSIQSRDYDAIKCKHVEILRVLPEVSAEDEL